MYVCMCVCVYVCMCVCVYVCAKKMCPPYLSNGFSNYAEIFGDILGSQKLALINFWAKLDKFLMGSLYKPYNKKRGAKITWFSPKCPHISSL
jgi:hypothetical protein